MIGRQLAQFKILEALGEGGMGVVYRARDERLHRDVAIKLLHPGTLSSRNARHAVMREAQALSRLNHPGIATVHDFVTIDEMDFIVMEYIPGESLDEKIARGPLDEAQVLAIGLQMADALAEAHRQGLIHRDLKPGNLRLTPEGRLKILDFGLALRTGPLSGNPSTVTATDPHSLTGTPAYFAPELLRGEAASERSDLYAAGLVLYEAATGQRPFQGLSGSALFQAVLHGTPPTPRSIRPTISPALEAVLLRCLENEPARRHASARELAADFERVHGGSSAARTPWLSRRVPPALGWTALAVVLAAGVLGYALWRRAHGAGEPAAALRSIAVLPLGNLSGDPDQEYFADGMTEELISQLSHVSALRVISLTSAMRYKKSRPSMPQIARELNVDGVLEGNVVKVRGRLRTTVHLIAAREDRQLWSGRYDGDTTDALALQSRLARAVVGEIQVRLSPEERSRLAEKRRADPLAYQFYLRGRYQWNRRSTPGIRLAIDYFERAIARDSAYALPYAGLADAWAEAGLYGMIPPLEARERALQYAQRAVALAPDLTETHTSLGHILHNYDWKWDEADVEYRRAIELNASNALAHHWRSHLLAQRGLFDEARSEVAEAESLDPLSVTIVLGGGVLEYYARRYDAALEHVRRAAEIDSSSAVLHRLTAAILDRKGDHPGAIRELSQSFALQGHPELGAAISAAFERAGMNGALQVLVGALQRKRASGAYEPAEHLAEIYARLGRTEEAFRWLAVAYREHDTELNRLRVDPIFDPLRSDPRFAELLHRVGLDAPPAAR